MAFDDGVKTVSGSVAHTDDAATKVPFVSVKCGIEPTLTGKSEVVCTQTEKNIYDKNAGVYDDTYFNQDGTTTHYADVAVSWIRVKPNTKYTFSLGATPSRSTFLRWINCDKDKNFISRPVATYGSQNFPYTVTTPNDCHWVQLAINEYPAAQVSSNDWIIQIEENSSATAYEAYNGTTYTVSLGRTIYGGTADIVNGEGRETHKIYTASDVTAVYWNKHKDQQVDTNHRASFRITLSSGYITQYNSMCNTLSYSTSIGGGQGSAEGYQIIPTAGIYFCIDLADIGMENATSSTPDADFINAIHNYGDNLKFVVELATPNDFTFTPITPTPETVGNVNNVYCNTGDTEVTYHDNAHGFTSVTVNKTGKNLFDISKVPTTGPTAGISWSVSGKEITISGTATSSGWKTFVEFKLPHKGTYHFHMNATGNVGYFLRGWTQLVGKDVTEVCNDPSQVYRIAIAATTIGQTYEGTISEIQIEVGDAYTSYEPYEAVSKTAYLHKVIYGGKADVIKGTCEPKNLTQYTTAFISTANVNVQQLIFSIDLTGGQAYTISCKQSESVSTSDRNTIGIRPRGGSITWENTTANFNPTNLRHVLTYTPPTSGTYEVIFWANKPTTIATYNEWQVEKSNSASDYAPGFTPFTFTPISMETDEGENTLFANEGASAITYRKETD